MIEQTIRPQILCPKTARRNAWRLLCPDEIDRIDGEVADRIAKTVDQDRTPAARQPSNPFEWARSLLAA